MSQMPQQPNHRAVAGMSRRKALLAGAGVTAGTAALATGVVRLTSDGDDAADAADAVMPAAAGLGVPVMLRLTDARRGAFDLYVGREVVHVADRSFAARVVGAARRTQH